MINTRKIAEEYRLTHWAQIMRERAASGLNIKEFCKHIGICQNTYFYWQRRVRAAACRELTAEPKNETVKSTGLTVPSGWVVCGEKKAERPEEAVSIEIGKCRVRVNADTNPELLVKVCKALTSLC